ncbi:MAG: substrate-binding domain-containing protein [Pseudomonadota bacterium]|nr:substrate-binding domain-containing protein [Pseudomonadota bacterium]
MKLRNLLAAVSFFTFSIFSQAETRDYIEIVGSSTVYPFSIAVAERFGKATQYKTPKIESTGSGGGMKLFCNGIGAEYPDITNASRRIKSKEFSNCQKNGVTDIIEVLIGYDGIAFANSNEMPLYQLSTKDIYLALAKDIPNPDGSETFIPNPYVTWKDVNDSLPATKIEVLGPPPTSGTRDAFTELALEGGCKAYSWVKALKKVDKPSYKARCHTIREDGVYIEAGENDNLIVNKLVANPNAFGVFGFSFLDQNTDKVQGSSVSGFEPTFESIAAGDYPISRPLYFYVKKAHIGVIPGIEGYLREFTAESTWGEEGYLSDRGMIPLDDQKRAAISQAIKSQSPMTLD